MSGLEWAADRGAWVPRVDHPGDAWKVLNGLRLEDGRAWGTAAADFQRVDARQFLEGDRRRNFWLRPRGASKSTDAGACLLALLASGEAPARSRSYLIAVDADQAALIADAVGGFVERSNGTLPVTVSAKRVTAIKSGATIEVLASDGASAFGLRPWCLILDELASWPETANHRRLQSALLSALPKVRDSRALVITTPGDPSHPSHGLWERAVGDPETWYASHVPGPTPWWLPADVEAARLDLLPAEFARLVLCEWAAADDRLTTLEDIRALVTHPRFLDPVGGRDYVITLDVGTRNDPTAAAVSHLELGPLVVADRVETWVPRRGREVDLRLVGRTLLDWSRRYNGASVVYDPSQAVKLAQDLASEGVQTVRWDFTTANINRASRGLYGAIRDGLLGLPDVGPLIDELAHVVFKESSTPGHFRLDHTHGRHDDQAQVLALAVDHFLGNRDAEVDRKRKLALTISVAGLEGSPW